MDTCLKHFNYLLEVKNEKTAILEMRTHAAWYLKGLPGSSIIKAKICTTKNSDELFNILNEYLESIV